MSEVLSRSRVAQKFREQIVAKLHANERILSAVDARVQIKDGIVGSALVVTSARILVIESKLLGRVGVWGYPWSELGGNKIDGLVIRMVFESRTRLTLVTASLQSQTDKDLLIATIHEARESSGKG